MKTSALIIGGDHHNTLSVLRCLSKAGCDSTVLLHSPDDIKYLAVPGSKYAHNNVFRVSESPDSIFDWLISHNELYGSPILTCSDTAAYAVDKYYMELEKHYRIPGFTNQPGKVIEFMDKKTQYCLAVGNDIPMASTWSVQLDEASRFADEYSKYPCIIKPEVSALGRKADIEIVDNREQLLSELNVFQKKGYSEVLVQEYIKKQYEALACGCILEYEPFHIGGVIKKIREYPPEKGGSTALGQFIFEDRVIQMRDRVIKILRNAGYRGQYDIEFFVCDDKVYLNEINFRHSGSGYVLTQNNVPAPYFMLLDMLNETIPPSLTTVIDTPNFNMCEIEDFKNVMRHNIGFYEWFKQFKNCTAFALYDKQDKKGMYAFYITRIRIKIDDLLRRMLLFRS